MRIKLDEELEYRRALWPFLYWRKINEEAGDFHTIIVTDSNLHEHEFLGHISKSAVRAAAIRAYFSISV